MLETVLGTGDIKDGKGPYAQQLTFQWGKINSTHKLMKWNEGYYDSEGLEGD